MTNVALKAQARTETKKKFKEAGYVPGVMYGDGIEATTIKVDEKDLRKILSEHGGHARIDVTYGRKKNSGFIKEVQTKPINNAILHVDIQVVSDTHEIKMQVPVHFTGTDMLMKRQLILQTAKSEIEVSGIMSKIPEEVTIDVSDLEYGDKIEPSSFTFGDGVTVLDEVDTIFGAIIHASKMEEPETEDRAVDGAPTDLSDEAAGEEATEE